MDTSPPNLEPDSAAEPVDLSQTDEQYRGYFEEAHLASQFQRQQSQKLEAIGQLAGSIAHDFNNMLTAISSEKQETVVLRGSETILLVEDEEIVRGLTKSILMQAGYNVLDAKGGKEAIRVCCAHTGPIDLLLTDVVMPEISGKEVADRLLSLRPEIRVLFMSGYTDEAVVQHGVLDANVEFIQKPFTWFGLTRKVRDVLNREA
jgi:CheY-like chemotaxis protein